MDLNDTIDDEDTLCIPSLDNIQPYQFEPMSEMGSNATEMSEISDHSDEFEDVHADHEEEESRDIRLDNLAWQEMLFSSQHLQICFHFISGANYFPSVT